MARFALIFIAAFALLATATYAQTNSAASDVDRCSQAIAAAGGQEAITSTCAPNGALDQAACCGLASGLANSVPEVQCLCNDQFYAQLQGIVFSANVPGVTDESGLTAFFKSCGVTAKGAGC